MEVEGGIRYFIGIKIHVEHGVFGVPVSDIPTVHVEGIGEIPEVLVKLKEVLYKHNALSVQGIFRHAGNEKDISITKDLVMHYSLLI